MIQLVKKYIMESIHLIFPKNLNNPCTVYNISHQKLYIYAFQRV